MTVTIHWAETDQSNTKSIRLSTPAGILKIFLCGNVISKTEWCFEITSDSVAENRLAREIQAYLNKKTRNLAINLQKQGTGYRNKVWNEICKIPAGQVITYSVLAKKIDSGARAVANACRDNPFPGIIPCHRVVSVAGLGGYMGQSNGKFLEIKKKLLDSESAQR